MAIQSWEEEEEGEQVCKVVSRVAVKQHRGALCPRSGVKRVVVQL